MTLPVTNLTIQRRMAVKFNEQRILKHVEGSGRGNPPDSSPMTVIVPAGIQTGPLPNTRQGVTA